MKKISLTDKECDGIPVYCSGRVQAAYRAFRDMLIGTEYMRTIAYCFCDEWVRKFFTNTHELTFAEHRQD